MLIEKEKKASGDLVNKFFQSAGTMGNNSEIKENTQELALNQSPKLIKIHSAPVAIGKNMQMTQTAKHQQGDHTFRNVLLFVIVASLVIFFVDLHKEMDNERLEFQIKRKRCYNDFMDNQCENPVDAIRPLCHQLQVCFKVSAEMSVRGTQSAAKLIGKLVEVFLKETGKWGALMVLTVLSILLFFIYKLSRTQQTHQTRIKKHD